MLIANCFAVTLIAGMAFATPLSLNLQGILGGRTQQNSNLVNQDNRVCTINANSACTGSFVGNSVSTYNCENSIGDVQNNRNSVVSTVSSTLTVKSNTNAKIEAENAWCKFEDNSNLSYKGRGGKQFMSEFIGNRNSKFEGNDNKVLAYDNTNLAVGGDNNQLDISRTRNHAVRPTGSTRSYVTISKPNYATNDQNRNYQRNQYSSIRFDIEYVGSARIDGSRYQLGNYNFDATQSNGMVRVSLQDGSVTDNTSNRVLVQGMGRQSVEFIGDRVEVLGSKSFNIYCQ